MGWTMVLLGSALVLAFNLYPLLDALVTSLYTGVGKNMTFAGLENYRRMLTDMALRKSFFNTVLYLVIQVPVMTLLALALASALNDPRLRCKGLFRTAFFLPCITASVSYSLLFKNLFSSEGVVNRFLLATGLCAEPIGWLTDPLWAKVLIIIAITWRWTGYNMIFYLAGLQNVDPQIYEAASLDGAGPVRKLFSITIPALRPIVVFTTINSTVGTLQLFDEVMNITRGEPAGATQTISQYVYELCFQYVPNFGYATAISVVVVVLIALLSAVQLKLGEEDA